MNLWIRMIIVIVRSFWKGRSQPTTELILNFRVWLTEADFRLFNNARYFSMMELGRLDMMLQTGVFKWAMRNKFLPLVASQTIRYKQPIKRFQKFQLKSRLRCWDEKYFYVEQTFFREGKLMAAGIAKACVLGKSGVVAPARFFTENGYSLPSPPTPEMISKWQESEKSMLSGLES